LRVASIRKQAGQTQVNWSAGFITASGRAFPQEEKVWMFDNEIDWVKRIRLLSLVPAAARQAGRMSAWMTRYKAEHKQLSRELSRSDSE